MSKPKKPRVPRTRCGGRLTEAGFAQFFKNVLRKASMRHPPYAQFKMKNRLPDKITNEETGRLVFAVKCSGCDAIIPEKKAVTDHKNPIVPTDKTFKPSFFKDFDDSKHVDLDYIAERMFAEEEAYQVLCKRCNSLKSDMSQEDWLKKKKKIIKDADDRGFEYKERATPKKRSKWKVKKKRDL